MVDRADPRVPVNQAPCEPDRLGLALTIFAGGLGLVVVPRQRPRARGRPAEAPVRRHRRLRAEGRAGGRADALPPVGARVPVVAADVAVAFYLMRTRFGLNCARSARRRARRTRWGSACRVTGTRTSLAGGALAGIGGACYSLAITPGWTDGDSLVGGAGWIAIALVIFSFWRPSCASSARTCSAGCPAAPVRAAGARVQDQARVPQRAAVHHDDRRARARLVGLGRRRLGAPAALGIPYVREER